MGPGFTSISAPFTVTSRLLLSVPFRVRGSACGSGKDSHKHSFKGFVRRTLWGSLSGSRRVHRNPSERRRECSCSLNPNP